MKHSVQHDLDIPTSKKATNKAIEAYQERFAKYEPKLTWNTDTKAALAFTVKGMSVTGEIELRAGAIDVDISMPIDAARTTRYPASNTVDSVCARWLAHSTSARRPSCARPSLSSQAAASMPPHTGG